MTKQPFLGSSSNGMFISEAVGRTGTKWAISAYIKDDYLRQLNIHKSKMIARQQQKMRKIRCKPWLKLLKNQMAWKQVADLKQAADWKLVPRREGYDSEEQPPGQQTHTVECF